MRSTLGFALAAFAATVALAPGRTPAAPLFGQAGDDFKMGTWAVELGGAYIHPIRFSDDKFYQANATAHYYFGDDVSVGIELQGYYVDQPDEDTAILGGGPLLRWHFFEQPRYSLFVDGGVGASIADAEVPQGGTHFNWTGKGGVGATIELREDLHLVGGARFFHISNGNLHGRDENPSQDGIQYWLGVLLTF
jgi:hypothetical protein